MTLTQTPQLTALDRCDSCGSRAYVRVVMSYGEFAFCAHHARKNVPLLRLDAITIVDETAQLHSPGA